VVFLGGGGRGGEGGGGRDSGMGGGGMGPDASPEGALSDDDIPF
jgi:hypothetical protein